MPTNDSWSSAATVFRGAASWPGLLEAGAEVLGISRSPEADAVFLPYKWMPHDRFTFRQLDLNRDLDKLEAALREFQPDYVVNFAAQGMVAQSWQNPEHWYQTNTIAMVRLHERLRKCKFLKKFVQASTPEVYGSTSGVIREDAPFNPSTPYAISKAACDMNLLAYHKAYGFPVAFTRSANVCGPGQALYRIIPKTILCDPHRQEAAAGRGRAAASARSSTSATWSTPRSASAVSGTPGGIYHLSTDQRPDRSASWSRRSAGSWTPRFEDCVEVTEARLGQDAAYLLD